MRADHATATSDDTEAAHRRCGHITGAALRRSVRAGAECEEATPTPGAAAAARRAASTGALRDGAGPGGDAEGSARRPAAGDAGRRRRAAVGGAASSDGGGGVRRRWLGQRRWLEAAAGQPAATRPRPQCATKSVNGVDEAVQNTTQTVQNTDAERRRRPSTTGRQRPAGRHGAREPGAQRPRRPSTRWSRTSRPPCRTRWTTSTDVTARSTPSAAPWRPAGPGRAVRGAKMPPSPGRGAAW